MKSVSIIIPVYQVSDYIERCIKSVIAQTYTDIECIIVDDATHDDSIFKCEKLIHNYGGPICFQIIHHGFNRGLSAARNTGIMASKGKYVFYLDSDDEIIPNCIELLVTAFQEHPVAEMVIGNCLVFKNNRIAQSLHDEGLPTVILSNEEFVSYYHHHQLSFSAWNKLIKRSFIETHKLLFREGILYEDYLWMFYVAKYLSAVVVIKEITIHYYVRADSITMSADQRKVGESYYIIFDDILHHLTEGREKRELNYCVERFSKHYLKQKATIHGYRNLYGLYLKLAMQNRSLYASIVLVFVGIVGIFGNPYRLLLSLHSVRWKVKRLAWKNT